MKKFAMMLAAGVVALGASAQAASVASTDTYAVITIPVVQGDNLIGVSVAPLNGESEPMLTDVLEVDTGKDVLPLNAEGDGYGTATNVQLAPASVGKAYWYTSDVDTYLFEYGRVPASATPISVIPGVSMAAVTVPSAWTFANMPTTGFTSSWRPTKADKIHVWNTETQGYDIYWLKSGGVWSKWSDGSSAAAVPVGAGQGFFIESVGTSQFSVTINPASGN